MPPRNRTVAKDGRCWLLPQRATLRAPENIHMPDRSTPVVGSGVEAPPKHELKILPEFFAAVVADRKRFEIRKNDRHFQVGDVLLLKEWDQDRGYTGRSVRRVVTYKTTAFQADDYVVLGIAEPSTAATPGTPEKQEQEEDLARVDGSCSSGTGRATASSGEPTPALVQASDGAVHEWFELTYAQYLTIPRSVLQSMPHEWQERFVRCLCELDDAIDWRPKDGQYWVRLKDGEGRYVRDPFMDYQRGRRRIPLRNSDGGSNVA